MSLFPQVDLDADPVGELREELARQRARAEKLEAEQVCRNELMARVAAGEGERERWKALAGQQQNLLSRLLVALDEERNGGTLGEAMAALLAEMDAQVLLADPDGLAALTEWLGLRERAELAEGELGRCEHGLAHCTMPGPHLAEECSSPEMQLEHAVSCQEQELCDLRQEVDQLQDERDFEARGHAEKRQEAADLYRQLQAAQIELAAAELERARALAGPMGCPAVNLGDPSTCPLDDCRSCPADAYCSRLDAAERDRDAAEDRAAEAEDRAYAQLAEKEAALAAVESALRPALVAAAEQWPAKKDLQAELAPVLARFREALEAPALARAVELGAARRAFREAWIEDQRHPFRDATNARKSAEALRAADDRLAALEAQP